MVNAGHERQLDLILAKIGFYCHVLLLFLLATSNCNSVQCCVLRVVFMVLVLLPLSSPASLPDRSMKDVKMAYRLSGWYKEMFQGFQQTVEELFSDSQSIRSSLTLFSLLINPFLAAD